MSSSTFRSLVSFAYVAGVLGVVAYAFGRVFGAGRRHR